MEYKIVVNGTETKIADSFVKRNKTIRGAKKGHGEARLYVGSVKRRDWNSFFENFRFKGFFKKSDLLDYLEKSKFEYEVQSQKYWKNIMDDWFTYKQRLKEIEEEFLYFSFQDANSIQDKERFYIRSKDKKFWDLFRSLVLPTFTSLSIAKVEFNISKEIAFYFYPYLHSHEKFNHPIRIRDEEEKIKNNLKLTERIKKRLIKSRIGQGWFREKVIEEFGRCVISKVDDERILQASHIKPWVECSDGERLDKNNGLLFTPTLHKLFDLGFISFDEKGLLMVSNHISETNIKKLNLESSTLYNLNMNKERAKNLEFHRKEIFKR